MAKFQVIRPWFGVTMGQIVDLEKVHPALAANVRPVAVDAQDDSEQAAGIVAKAHAEGDAIIAEAHKQADAIIAEARSAAESFVPATVEQTGDLTPATPDATADKAKATKPK